MCSFCAQLSVCARNTVPQGGPSEILRPGQAPKSSWQHSWVCLGSEPALGLGELFPAVQEGHPLL